MIVSNYKEGPAWRILFGAALISDGPWRPPLRVFRTDSPQGWPSDGGRSERRHYAFNILLAGRGAEGTTIAVARRRRSFSGAVGQEKASDGLSWDPSETRLARLRRGT